VGTPGRVFDMISKGYLKTDYIKIMVLDEADEMLGRGFKDQINQIFKQLPSDIQVGLFSATMPPEILEITKQFMRNPATILVKNEELTLDGIKQFYIAIDKDEWKFETLVELYNNIGKAFCFWLTVQKLPNASSTPTPSRRSRRSPASLKRRTSPSHLW